MGIQLLNLAGTHSPDSLIPISGPLTPAERQEFLRAAQLEGGLGLTLEEAEDLLDKMIASGDTEAIRQINRLGAALEGDKPLTRQELKEYGFTDQQIDQMMGGPQQPGQVQTLRVASNPTGAIFLRLMMVGFVAASQSKDLFMKTTNIRLNLAHEAAREQFKGAIGQFVMSMASAALSLGMATRYGYEASRTGKLQPDGKTAYGDPNPWVGPMGAQLFSPTLTSTGQFISEYHQYQASEITANKEYLDRNIDLLIDQMRRTYELGTRS